MSTRRIKLSQKLTLRFRDTSKSDASAVADLLSEEPEENSSTETFDSLPDLLPYIFQTESPAPDLSYFVNDSSTYKLWESCTPDVIPLASQNEESEHWMTTGTQIREAIGSESSDDSQKNLKSSDTDSVFEATKIGVRENLRRVQAFSPHTSILYAEKDLNLDNLPMTESLWSAHDGVACDAVIENEGPPDPLDMDADTSEICIESYLILDEDMAKKSPSDKSTDADETTENSGLSSINQAPHGIEECDDKNPQDKQSTRRKSSYHTSDFPKEFRKQKRSTPKRPDRPSASINLVRKLNWLSDTGHEHLERDQDAQITENILDTKRKTNSKARQPRQPRKTVYVSSVKIQSNEPLASKPRNRRGRKKKPPL